MTRRAVEWKELSPDLRKQAETDYVDDTIWEAERTSFRNYVGEVLRQATADKVVSDAQIRGLENILAYNAVRRGVLEREAKKAAQRGEKVPPPVHLVPPPPPVESPVEIVPLPPILFNPRLNSAQIGEGWGLKSGSVVGRYREDFPDFPLPIAGTGPREIPMWSYLDIAGWTLLHQDEIRVSLARNSGGMKKVQEQSRVQQLEAEVARLRALVKE